jgi:hypothetical protein
MDCPLSDQLVVVGSQHCAGRLFRRAVRVDATRWLFIRQH